MSEPEIVLYFEDVRSRDGRMLSETEWVDPVPLMVADEDLGGEDPWGNTLVGAVTGIRREGHVVLGTPSISLKPYAGLATEPDFDKIGDLWRTAVESQETVVLRGARLRGVTLGSHPVWPGLEVGVECRPKTGWLSGERYCAIHGRTGGWPCRFNRGEGGDDA